MKIPLPGLNKPIGLGSAIAKATSAVGIKPCAPCKQRALRLDSALTFTPASSPVPAATASPAILAGSGELPPGHELVEKDGDTLLTKRVDGSLVVWTLRQGELTNSFAFCCSPERARAEFERRKADGATD